MRLLHAIVVSTLVTVATLSSAAGPDTATLVYSTYLGSDADEQGRHVALDAAGRAYVTGYTSSTVFPAPRAGDSPDHGVDVYSARFSPDGSALDYLYWFNALTLFAEDEGYSVAVDGQGNTYITGYTRSDDFCTVFGVAPGYHTTYYGETDAFVLKIKADGSGLAYCTFLGGADWDAGRAITVDSLGNAYVVGGTWSEDLPVTANAAQPAIAGLRDVFLAKLDPTGTALVYSTYLGGTGQEDGAAIAVTGEAIYAAGWSNSADFPTTAGVFGPVYGGNTDGFVFRLDRSTGALDYATYLGGAGDDRPTGLSVTGPRAVVVAGYTQSTDFPVSPGAFMAALQGGTDGFAAAVAPSGDRLEWATYLGGSSDDQVHAVARDGAVTLVGETKSTDFPVTSTALFPQLNGPGDAFLAQLNSSGQELVYGSFLGGSNTDRAYGVAAGATAGDLVIAGITLSNDFPTTPLAYDTEYNGSGDIFVTRLDLGGTTVRSRVWLPLVRREA